MTVIIKKVDETNPAIAHCLMYLQKTTLPSDDIRPLANDEWWIAYQDGVPVGFAAFNFCDSTTGYLSRSGVLYSARGHGLQKRLIKTRLNYAKRNGVTVVLCDTSQNPASANSLISQGFRLYDPVRPWALSTSLYWKKTLTR